MAVLERGHLLSLVLLENTVDSVSLLSLITECLNLCESSESSPDLPEFYGEPRVQCIIQHGGIKVFEEIFFKKDCT